MAAMSVPRSPALSVLHVLATRVPRLADQLGASFAWTCVRLPGEASFVLDCLGPRPGTFPQLEPICYEGPPCACAPAPVRAVIPLRYLEAGIDVVVGRPTPLDPPESLRMRRWRRTTQDQLQHATLQHLAVVVATREAEQRALERRMARFVHDVSNDLVPAIHAYEFLAEANTAQERLRLCALGERLVLSARHKLRAAIHPLGDPRGRAAHDWQAVIAELAEGWQLSWRRHGTFVLELPAHPVRVPGTPGELGSIVGNLLANARKYTPAGGTVSLRLHAEAGRAHLEVQDTGPGIPPELRPRVFQRGVRGAGPEEGSGQGLADVARLVAELGGEWAVDSLPGLGTRVHVYLPLLVEPAP